MPIIDLAADSAFPLTQGDILKGVSLFQTRQSWDNSGQAQSAKSTHCLVLSRPCVAVRDEWVVVCAIDPYRGGAPVNFESFDECVQFFSAVRDGLKSPDLFYLGQLPGESGVFAARFSSLHTIQIPKDSEQRLKFVQSVRVAKLNRDFIHDLHLRIFRAFASLGFDDHNWFSTDDLRSVVSFADRDLAEKTLELTKAKAKLHMGVSQGAFQHPSAKATAEKDLQVAQARVDKIIADAKPYRDALAEREQSAQQGRAITVLEAYSEEKVLDGGNSI